VRGDLRTIDLGWATKPAKPDRFDLSGRVDGAFKAEREVGVANSEDEGGQATWGGENDV